MSGVFDVRERFSAYFAQHRSNPYGEMRFARASLD